LWQRNIAETGQAPKNFMIIYHALVLIEALFIQNGPDTTRTSFTFDFIKKK